MDIGRCRIWWPRQELQLTHKPFSPPGSSCSDGSSAVLVLSTSSSPQLCPKFTSCALLPHSTPSRPSSFPQVKRMPVSLQEFAALTVLGDCGRQPPKELEEYCVNKSEQPPLDANFVQKEHFGTRRNNAMIGSVGNGDQGPSYDHRRSVGMRLLCVLDGFLDACRKSAVKEGTWVHLYWEFGKNFKSNLNQVPVLHHLYLDGPTD